VHAELPGVLGVASALTVQLVVTVPVMPASDAASPAAVPISVSGASAETDSEPPPVSAVQRTCGMRTTPASPVLPPNSTTSESASGSRKFEVVWPANRPPNVP